MLPAGRYVLQASVLGIAEKAAVVDGSKIKSGDAVIALASNGLHTNGYSLVRKLMETKPEILDEKINGESFMDAILKPHTSYAGAVAEILRKYPGGIHGMAHITGGGIHDNLIRILQDENIQANVDLSAVRTLPLFALIKKYAGVGDEEMLKTFNNGAGLIVVADAKEAGAVIETLNSAGAEAYRIGSIGKSDGNKRVVLENKLRWD
jgi:phosphoribosylformylglycinamidine cyclo-ligase